VKFYNREKIVRKCEAIESRYFPDHRWPADVYKKLLSACDGPGLKVAHLGCGHDQVEVRECFLKSRIVGFDMDLAALTRYRPTFCVLANLEMIPVQDNSFDLLISEFVLEHLKDPGRVFAECHRILRPGGEFIFLTINRNSIPAWVARVTPLYFHRWIKRMLPRPTQDEDVFPTYYRCNRYSTLSQILKHYRFEEIDFQYLDGSFDYLQFSPLLYRLGNLFNVMLLRFEILKGLRVALLGVYRRGMSKGLRG